MLGELFYKFLDKLRGVKRVRTPTRIQMEAVECGSTSLGIIMAYYKKYVPPSEVRYRCGVSRDGSDAYNLIQAAEYYGFEAEGVYATVAELRDEIAYPAILYWESSHFVVLEGFHGDWVYINDPAIGPITHHINEFEKRYSGIALTVKVSEKFERGGEKTQFFGPLIDKVKNMKASIFAFLVLESILVILGISFAIFIQIFIDEVLKPPMVSWVVLFLWSFVVLVLMNFFVTWIQEYILNRTQIKISILLSTSFFLHILRLPLTFFQQRYIGEILSRMSLNIEVASFVVGQLAQTIVNVSVLGIYLLIIYQYDSIIGFLTLGIILLNLVLILVVNELRKHSYAHSQQIAATYSGVSIDSIQNIESIRLVGSESFAFHRLAGTNADMINTFQMIGKRDTLISSFTTFSNTLSVVALMAFGGWRVMYGSLTPGMYVTLQILISSALTPLVSLTNVGMRLPLLKCDLQRIDDVMKNAPDPLVVKKERGDITNLPQKIEGNITVKNVTYGYQPLGDPLMENISLSVTAGEMVGITGPNGSGKSSLIRLIAGQHTPWEGEIFYDNINICKEPLTGVIRCVAFVERDALFVPGTILENLTLWEPDINEEDLYQACKDAYIYNEIMSRKDQFNYVMDENASDFSEGQRQRLNLARALLFKPTILILDEALNGLEDAIQNHVISSIKKRVKTMLVISHRKHVLDLCDKVFVFDNGQLMRKN